MIIRKNKENSEIIDGYIISEEKVNGIFPTAQHEYIYKHIYHCFGTSK